MPRPNVILFDVNETLLDLQSVKESVGTALGGRPELAPLWFTTLLQYSLVGTVADQYLDFGEVGAACLRMVAKNYGIDLSEDAATNAIAPMRSLPPHPDVLPALGRLRDANFRLVTLTHARLGEPAFGISPAHGEVWATLRTRVINIAGRVADTQDPKVALEYIRELTGKLNGKKKPKKTAKP